MHWRTRRGPPGTPAALGLALALIALSGTCQLVTASLDPHLSTEANLVRLEATMLARSQFSHHPLDRELARRFFHTYLDTLDERRSLLLRSDVDEYATAAARLPEAIRAGDTQLAFQLRARYLERLAQRAEYVRGLLSEAPFQFTTDEAYDLDRANEPRPKDLTAAHALWKRHLRAEYLDEKLQDVAADHIAPKLARRYEQQLLTERSLRDRDVLSLYLNALATVYDPHSQYLDAERLQSFETKMVLSLSGIGASLARSEGYCKIVDVVPGSPAAQSALSPGDRIIAVAQAGDAPVDVSNLPLARIVALIRGPRGSRVTLTVLPATAGSGTHPIEVSLVRENVQLADERARAQIVDLPGSDSTLRLGVIEVPSFYGPLANDAPDSRRVSSDVRRLLGKLTQEGVQGLLLDLRKNGGGSLQEAVVLTGLFLRSGPIVQTRDPAGNLAVLVDPNPRQLYSGPLVVLTSRMSASASEIMAGALQDCGRAIIVGDMSTFGKGTVQNVVSLGKIMNAHGFEARFDPGALIATVGKFYRPSGDSTQLCGVRSSVVIPSLTDLTEIGEAALDHPLPWDMVRPAAYVRQDRVAAVVPWLRERSEHRVASNPVFGEVLRSQAVAREQQAHGSVTLNEARRRDQLARGRAGQETLVRWWKARAHAAPPSYEIRVEHAADKGLPPPEPFASFDPKLAARAARAAGDAERLMRAGSAADDLVLQEAVDILADLATTVM